MSVIANPPFPSYFDVDGSPLEDGYLYFGTANQNPETNPITVYWDSAYLIPAAQPIRTSGGFAVRNGSPANVYVTTDYSLTVRDKNRRLVYSKLLSEGQTTAEVDIQFSTQTVTATSNQTVFSLTTAYTPGNQSLAVYQNGSRLVVAQDYTETTANSVTLTIGATSGDVLQFVTATPINPSSLGAASVAYIPAGVGAVATDVQSKLREVVSVKDFGAVGDGVADDTVAIQAAVNAAQGKRLLGVSGQTYLIKDQITVPSNVEMDWQGSTLLDDVRTFRPANQANRAKPLFYMYGVSNIKISGFTYLAAATRATVSNNVPTGIIWIGDNSTTGSGPTRDIEISDIQASSLALYSMFAAVVGESYNLYIHDIDITGSCSYGINIEYGEAPTGTTDALAYGLHPYNVLVERFNGYDNSASVGFLRVASCYNVKFSNCYGKNVKNFIYAWGGDRNISRVSENVTFENCSHYAASTFLSGVVNYVVQILIVNKDGSTGDPLPSWTNYDHLFRFVGCQFQNNKVTNSTAIRFYGAQGKTVFDSCVFQNSYYGVWAQPSTNPDYTPEFSLTLKDCTFKSNTRDVLLGGIRGVVIDHCTFKSPDNVLIPVKLESSAIYNRITNCTFGSVTGIASYILVDPGCINNEISGCVFPSGATIASIDLSAITEGRGNISGPTLCRTGWAYYGLLSQPEARIEDISLMPAQQLDAGKRSQYVALLGSVNVTVSEILNGRLGDEIVVQAASSGATVTFNHFASGVSTLNRILTPAGTNLVKTGSFWTVRLKSTSVGWVLA